MIPPHAKEFLEAFGGSAALSLALKPKKGRLDIYNDVDDDLFNVFCCIKERPNALARELKFLPVHGRTSFQFNSSPKTNSRITSGISRTRKKSSGIRPASPGSRPRSC